MPQGSYKKSKCDVPKQKDKLKRKISVLKKGARDIAPKKARHIEHVAIKKNVEKAIRLNVEKQMLQRVSEVEGQSSVMKTGKTAKHAKTSA